MKEPDIVDPEALPSQMRAGDATRLSKIFDQMPICRGCPRACLRLMTPA
jgi:hypothetical protein